MLLLHLFLELILGHDDEDPALGPELDPNG